MSGKHEFDKESHTMRTPERFIQALLLFFAECLLEHVAIGDSTYLHIYRGANGCWPLFCSVLDSRYVFSSLLPVTVPQERSEAVVRYLHRANYALQVGGRFEFEENTGEVRFTTVLDVADGIATTCMLFVLYDAHRVADFHLARLLQLVHGVASPQREAPAAEMVDEDDLLDLLDDIDLGGLDHREAV
jgi:hypothetical protein